MKKIINLTPHVLNFPGEVAILPTAPPARVMVSRLEDVKLETEHGEIQVYVPAFGSVENLPDYEKGTFLVVSALVRNHPDVKDRIDLFSPGAPIRDEHGTIIGADGVDASRSIGWSVK